MNKEIQQEAKDVAAKRYPMMGTYLSNDVVMNRKHFAKGYICHAAISQQKQDERMIEFAEWIEKESWKANYAEQKTLSTRELLTIFNTEKGY